MSGGNEAEDTSIVVLAGRLKVVADKPLIGGRFGGSRRLHLAMPLHPSSPFSHARLAATVLAALAFAAPAFAAPDAPLFTDREAEVNGVRLHYRIGGKGRPVVLLHGYAQTSHMWRPILPLLAANHTVIVPDLRGAGGSGKPESGYDKKNMAVDIHELSGRSGFERVSIVGHDIGLMVAYAYAAQFPEEMERLVLMDAFLPGIGRLEECLADARSLALPLLRRGAAGPGRGARADLLRALLERLRRRPQAFGV